MRTIGVVTVARSDYGIYIPVLRRIQGDPELRLHLMATGMHLSPEFGSTIRTIEEDGFEIAERVEMLLSSDTPEAIAKSMGLGTMGFAQVYARFRPDILLVLGDRFEMHAAAVASLPFNIPLAHIHGGESTQGAIDEALRHSLTKMSHLHFAATEEYSHRIIQMGEEPWRVTVTGAPGLDHLHETTLLELEDLERRYGLSLGDPFLLMTYHPVTLEYEETEEQVEELLGALEESGYTVVCTAPNADTNGRTVARMLESFAENHPRIYMAGNLGTQGYFSMMKYATAIVGNSSSGIVEAASFKLPVVNIGSRQTGRVRAENVIDVGYNRRDILAGIERATSSEFKASLDDVVNPYGDGHAAVKIVDRLKRVQLNDELLKKRFYQN